MFLSLWHSVKHKTWLLVPAENSVYLKFVYLAGKPLFLTLLRRGALLCMKQQSSLIASVFLKASMLKGVQRTRRKSFCVRNRHKRPRHFSSHIQVLNTMRVNKWWQICIFGWTIPLTKSPQKTGVSSWTPHLAILWRLSILSNFLWESLIFCLRFRLHIFMVLRLGGLLSREVSVDTNRRRYLYNHSQATTLFSSHTSKWISHPWMGWESNTWLS